jgi:hypothetical protein
LRTFAAGKKTLLKLLIFFISCVIAISATGQTTDSTKGMAHFGGTITATQNGISLIPSFSLGKPALMCDLNIGNKKLTFEPFLRFSMEGKPWAFVFWWRYKAVNHQKFKLTVGAHPSYVFRITDAVINGSTKSIIQTTRYAAGEIAPNYFVSRHTSIGVYYLYSHGLDKTAVQNTHFLTFNAHFSNLKITNRLFARFMPQVYYLRQDNKEGYYATYTLTLLDKKIPLGLQTIMNKAIQSSIPAKSFLWNVSVLYNFNKNYTRRK